ncbi:MAG: CRTAC1 family protein [Verrucomicrobiota bacterium]
MRVPHSSGPRRWSWLLAPALALGVGAAPVLTWENEPGGRSAALTIPAQGKTGFTLLRAADTGITFTNRVSDSRSMTNHILFNGAGVAAGDVDGDGLCDLYFCRSEGSNVLYHNLGNFRFEDVTAAAGVACTDLGSTGAAFADLNGDGSLDLVVNTLGHGTHVFFNDGQGHFKEAGYVLNGDRGGMTLALADVDGDGFLDLFIANHRTSSMMDLPGARVTFKKVNGKLELATFNGRPMSEPELAHRFAYDAQDGIQELGEVPAFYRNVGGTSFSPVPFTGGAFLDEDGQPLTEEPYDWGLSAAFHDVNGDGLPDLYVCNDFLTPDRLWINQGGGKFRLVPRLAQRKSSMSSMAVDFADINRDGFVDFFVLDMMSRSHSERMRFMKARPPVVHTPGLIENRPQYELNTLFLNRGDTTFAEIGQLAGLQAAEWAWSCIFLDVDLDGWEDVLVANGMERAGRDLDVTEHIKQLRAGRNLSDAEVYAARRQFPRQTPPKLAFRNRHDLTFEETGHAWGFDWPGVSSSIVLADLDNDGDLDVVANNLNEGALIFRNDSIAPRVAVRLRGQPPNTHGIGARITVTADGLPPQTQEMIAGGRYLGGDDPVRSFAARTPTNRLAIQVQWRNGRSTLISAARPNRLYEIAEPGSAPPAPAVAAAPPRPLFEDVSDRLAHRHHEEAFDDWTRQPLLPAKLSQLGPGVAWFDVDGDGWDDLVIASGKGGALSVFHNNGAGGFTAATPAAFAEKAARDQTAVVGWVPEPGKTNLLVGTANYEDGLVEGAAAERSDFAAGTNAVAVPANDTSTGPIAVADVDGDGALDVFVGGRVVPGKYPLPGHSRVFLNRKGALVLDTNRTEALANAGLVSGAVFADLDGDGRPDLVLAGDWGPIRVFHNNGTNLVEWNAPVTWPESTPGNAQLSTLSQLAGWWSGIAVGDFDEDGRLDIVAGNWGRNSPCEPFRDHALRLYYGDFGGGADLDLAEAHYDPDLRKYVPARQRDPLTKAIPSLIGRFPTHREYSTAGIEEVLGEAFKSASVVEANWLETTVFLNRGDHFEAHVLPIEAQMAPVFGVCVADADGDGHEDIFLAQNFFDSQPETPRYDAGRGLWLRGDGHGGFRAMPGQESGVMVYGEQRGAAVGDYDGDGRVDLVVAQNGAATRLFHNVMARPGLRVRLAGPAGNPQAIGAAMRLRFGERWGPLREVHAGGGYWSQDAATQVLGAPTVPTQIEVRWPGGNRTVTALPADAKTIVVQSDGRVTTAVR